MNFRLCLGSSYAWRKLLQIYLNFCVHNSQWWFRVRVHWVPKYEFIFFGDRVPGQNCSAATHIERVPKLWVWSWSDVYEAYSLRIAKYKLFNAAGHSSKALLQKKDVKLIEVSIRKHVCQTLLPKFTGVGLTRNALRKHLDVPSQHSNVVLLLGLRNLQNW